MNISACTYRRICICKRLYTYICIYISVAHTYTYKIQYCMCVETVSVCLSLCVYIHMYVCGCVCIGSNKFVTNFDLYKVNVGSLKDNLLIVFSNYGAEIVLEKTI